jgi:hypothetical protein
MASLKAIKFLTAPIGKGSILSGLLTLIKFASGGGTFLSLGATGLLAGGKSVDTKLKSQGINTKAVNRDFGAYGGRLPLDFLKQNYSSTSNITINVNGVVGDKVSVGKAVKEALTAYDKKNGNSSTIYRGGR